MSPVRLLLATRNDKKLVELRRILSSSDISGMQVLGLGDVPPFPEAPEIAATFEGNALAKARDAVAATGLATVADDSGLEADALGGMPGVLSARWAGRHGDDVANLQLVLDQLADVPDDRRGAAFVCAAALVVPFEVRILGTQVVKTQTVVRGHWRGTLTRAARGSNGFGYDPIFIPDGDWRTSAELDPTEKDAVSHRGRALRALLPALREFLSSQCPPTQL
ncbi:MAG: non-canonical purine NTP pyrophosphatase [Pseudonocardiales bacterium]|nr:non-canonical purine NTP pyrophosphatase [Pseudonocardiales bacterium]MBV9728054.1 non-canonical purine NTP pyrophosphatase [Pseudonocardiales bacterium]